MLHCERIWYNLLLQFTVHMIQIVLLKRIRNWYLLGEWYHEFMTEMYRKLPWTFLIGKRNALNEFTRVLIWFIQIHFETNYKNQAKTIQKHKINTKPLIVCRQLFTHRITVGLLHNLSIRHNYLKMRHFYFAVLE